MRPIDANALLKKCIEGDGDNKFTEGYNFAVQEISAYIALAPTIEPEVRHAYWEPSDVGEYHCTNCGVECDIDEFHKALLNAFCGYCGARMDGGDDNAE